MKQPLRNRVLGIRVSGFTKPSRWVSRRSTTATKVREVTKVTNARP